MSRWALPLRRVARLGAARRVRSRAALSTKDSSETETTPSPSLKERMKETVKLQPHSHRSTRPVYVLSPRGHVRGRARRSRHGRALRSWGLGDHVDMIPPEAGDLLGNGAVTARHEVCSPLPRYYRGYMSCAAARRRTSGGGGGERHDSTAF